MLSVEDISNAAFTYINVPSSDIDIPDRVLWWTLRSVYEDYRRGVLTKDVAAQIKRDAIQQHRIDAGQFTLFRDQMKHQAEMWQRVEQAANAYAKGNGRTPEGDALYEALYGKVLKEAIP